MPTSKKRVNLTVPEEVEHLLQAIAKRDGIPMTTVALKMLERGLVWEEDALLADLAESRDQEGGAFFSHEDAWK